MSSTLTTSIGILSRTLHYLGRNQRDLFVVQVGAMDGINFDEIRKFLDMYRWGGLFVEPIPSLFNEIKENFKDRSNYLFEQCAITEYDGDIEMVTIPDEIINQNKLRVCQKGMSTLYPIKNGLDSNLMQLSYGVKINVPCMTFKSLCDKHHVSKIGIFICDVEGYDWQVFKQLDLNKYRPSFMRIEYENLTYEEKNLTIRKLWDNGYLTQVGYNIDAVDASLWELVLKG